MPRSFPVCLAARNGLCVGPLWAPLGQHIQIFYMAYVSEL